MADVLNVDEALAVVIRAKMRLRIIEGVLRCHHVPLRDWELDEFTGAVVALGDLAASLEFWDPTKPRERHLTETVLARLGEDAGRRGGLATD